MRIDVLALDGVFDTGLAAILDVFTVANELAAASDLAGARFDVTVVGLRAHIRTSQGFAFAPASARQRRAPDWVVIPALSARTPDALTAALRAPDVVACAERLQHWSAGGVQIAAACVGTFVAAEAGVLDGERATTTWWLAPLFRARYPKVRLEHDRMIVRSGATLTAGAALSHVDMALWLVRQKSPSLADIAARYLIVDQRPSQSAYAMQDHLAHADRVVRRFEDWVRLRLAVRFSLDEAADAAGVTKRTLSRRVGQTLGKSPLAFVQDVRIERAIHLLRTTKLDVDAIAAAVGYADGVTLRNLLRRKVGLGVRDIRTARGED